jgi:hypothetical protein
MNFPIVDQKSLFYKNCKRQRKRNAKICQVCPFRGGIERQEDIVSSFDVLPEDVEKMRKLNKKE